MKSSCLRFLLFSPFVLLSCQPIANSETDCTVDGSCPPQYVSEHIACSADAECPSGMCGHEGICVESYQCWVTSECPIEMF